MSDPKIYKVNMDVEDNIEEQALEEIQTLIVVAVVFIVCAAAPEIAYRSSSRASIVERLREVE